MEKQHRLLSCNKDPIPIILSSYKYNQNLSRVDTDTRLRLKVGTDGYYVAYKPITLSCILFMFIEMKFIYCHSCVMFAMKSMIMCNDYVNYDKIIR